jgi:methylisocitrate lyase
MHPTTKLRHLLKTRKVVWIPGAYDVLSAKMVEQAGFDAVLMSGFGIAASYLGQPDAELYTMTENLTVLRNTAQAISIPIMGDADTGYGNALNVMRTMREFEAAGVASFSIEDQVSPKKCPAVSDQTDIIPIDEAVSKIRAAVAARKDPDLVIIARTDARNEEEGIRRAKAYVAAGADMIKPISKGFKSLPALMKLREACGVPLALSMIGWMEKELTHADYEAIGGIVTFPLTTLMTAANALKQNLAEMKRTLHVRGLPVTPMPEAEFKKLIGFDEIERLERAFLPAAAE